VLRDLLRNLAEKNNYSFQSTGDIHMVDIPSGGERTQVVHASVLNEGEEDEVFIFFAVIGEFSPRLDLEELIRVQMDWSYCKVGILSGDLVVCASLSPLLLAHDSQEPLLDDLLQELAYVGDRLEEDLFGTDIY
jgi:hypothetical protein